MRSNPWTVALVLLIASHDALPAAEYITGTGFMISPGGIVLTNRHVVARCVDPIEVHYAGGGRSPAVIIANGKVLDLALLATGFQNVPYLRLRAVNGKVTLPIRGEQIHTLGFIGGAYSPRGGLVAETSDPALFELAGDSKIVEAGAVIALNSGYGASGSPVLDNTGLLIGIIWGADFSQPSYAKPHMLNNAAIYGFLKANGVPAPMTNNGPYDPKDSADAWDHTVRIGGHLSETTVQITCAAG